MPPPFSLQQCPALSDIVAELHIPSRLRKWQSLKSLIVFGLALWTVVEGRAALAQTVPGATTATVSGQAVFDSRCKACHEPPIERAPSRTELGLRQRSDIVTALVSGVMAPQAKGLSTAEIRAVAAYLTPAQTPGAGSAQALPSDGKVPARRSGLTPVGNDVMCESNAPIQASASDWPSMGLDPSTSRFQRRPGLAAADVPRLKVKWSFAMPGGGQPTVVGDWLFITNRGGKFYALDAKSGCVHWAVEGAGSRTTPMVIRSDISPSGWATFIGLATRTVRAYDAQSGRELWTSESLDPSPVAGITGSPVIYGERLIVPITSGEEPAAIQPTYPCCSFRGSLAALDLRTGKRLWQTSMINEPLHPTHKNAAGAQLQGPAGAAIWAAPTIDAKRGLVYVVTGDSYTEVDTKGADAVMALEMNTGKVRWSNQVTTGDNYVMACEPQFKGPNCPDPKGPDYDFGASPILFPLKNGKDVVLAGQKSGAMYGLDADTGKLLWTTKVGAGSALGGIEWGIAADDRHVFVPVSDIEQLFDEVYKATGEKLRHPGAPPTKAGLYAIDPATGKVVWNTPAPVAPCHYAGDRRNDFTHGACVRAQSAAPAVTPGLVFSGTLDGWLRAYDARTGKIVWAFSTTAQTYDTVNQIKGQPGGGIDGMGPIIAGGMLYTMSGFNGASRTGANGNNVLLAFSVDGR